MYTPTDATNCSDLWQQYLSKNLPNILEELETDGSTPSMQ